MKITSQFGYYVQILEATFKRFVSKKELAELLGKNEKTIFRYLSDLSDEGIEFERKIENRIAKYKWNKKISETTDFMNTLSTVFISRLVKTDSFVIYEDKDVETPFVYLMKLSEG